MVDGLKHFVINVMRYKMAQLLSYVSQDDMQLIKNLVVYALENEEDNFIEYLYNQISNGEQTKELDNMSYEEIIEHPIYGPLIKEHIFVDAFILNKKFKLTNCEIVK